jgi:hypothetical protein
MSNQPNPIIQILYGILILIACHTLAITLLFVIGLLASLDGKYTVLYLWLYGGMGFFLWQLLYVIPLIFWLKRRGKIGMMQGVIGMAVVTALLNGGCSLLLFGSSMGR